MGTLCERSVCLFCHKMALTTMDCVGVRGKCTGLSIGLCDGMFSNITIMFCIGDQDTEVVIILEFQKMFSS